MSATLPVPQTEPPSLPPPAAGGGLRDLQGHAQGAASLLKAMANRHRLLILCALSEEELCVGALNALIPLSQSALSQHLAVLKQDGLVTARRAAQTVHYRVAPGPALDLIRVLRGHFCQV